MLIANGKNMRGDVVISASVLVGLGFTFVFGLPILDRVTALLVSLWIIKVAAGIFREANTELMDGTERRGPLRRGLRGGLLGRRRRQSRTAPGSAGSAPSSSSTSTSRSTPSSASPAAHDIAVAVERAIKAALPEVYDVIVHVEPAGNAEERALRHSPVPGDIG